MGKTLSQAFDAIGLDVVQLSEFYEVLSAHAHAPNMTGSGDKAQRTAHTSQCIGLKYSREFSGGLDAVLQGYDNSVWTHQRADPIGRLGHLPRFDADKNNVNIANLCRIIRRFPVYDAFACRC